MGVFLLGAWFGATIGLMVFDAVLAQAIGNSPKAQIGMWSVLGFFTAFGAILTLYLYSHAITVSSVFIGAYFLIRVGFSFLLARAQPYSLEGSRMSI